jgi:membrane protein
MRLLRKAHETRLLRLAIPLINKAKRISFPGFDKVPVYNVAIFFFRGLRDGNINRRASAVSYSLLLGLFPAIIFLFTLIPHIPITDFQDKLLQIIASVMPDAVYEAIEKTIYEIIKIKHGGLLSVGFVMAMYFSTNGLASLIQSFNASVNVIESRSWLMQRAIALLLVIILSLLITVGIALITVTQSLMNFLVEHELMKQDWTYYLITFGKWIVILAVFYFAYSFLFYLAPARKSKYRFISAGATLATILSIIITLGFGFYIDRFNTYNALYGSIGTLPMVMLMIYLNCMAIIMGFELNSGIVAARRIHIENKQKGEFSA